MQLNDRKQIIQKGFDTVAIGYDHPSLSFFPETHARQGWWKCWQCMEHLAVKRLVEHLQLKPTDNLLDDCTGTGCVALSRLRDWLLPMLMNGQVTVQ